MAGIKGMTIKKRRSPFVNNLTLPVKEDRFTVYEEFLMGLTDDEYYELLSRTERAFRKEVNNIEG